MSKAILQVDGHDYAEGTRVRRLLMKMLAPLVARVLEILLWLCPDYMVIANAEIGKRGAVLWVRENRRAIIVRCYFHAPTAGERDV